MEKLQIQDKQTVNDDASIRAPILSFLEAKVNRRFNDANRAQVESKLKLEHAKIRKSSNASDREIFTVQLEDSKIVDNAYVVYEIKIQKGTQEWSFQTRFSLLNSLHDRLTASAQKSLRFPEKRYFGNLETDFLEKRHSQLEKYLKNLFSNQEVLKSDVFQSFVKQTKLAATSINDSQSINHFSLDY